MLRDDVLQQGSVLLLDWFGLGLYRQRDELQMQHTSRFCRRSRFAMLAPKN